jgi:hypothetical protein
MLRLFLSLEIEDGNARTGIGDGSGCTWRLVAQPKTVNDTGCMAARMLAPLLAHNKACFGSLPQQPPDPAGTGFGSCFTQAIMGGAGIDPIAPVSAHRCPVPPPPLLLSAVAAAQASLRSLRPQDLLVSTWEQAFASDDPSQGGCPNLQQSTGALYPPYRTL